MDATKQLYEAREIATRLAFQARRIRDERDKARAWIKEIFHILGLPNGDMGALENLMRDYEDAKKLHLKALSEREAAEKESDLILSRAQQAEREVERLKKLDGLRQEYIQLLADEINDTAVLAHVHGWKSSRVEQGKQLREKINQLESKP